MHTLVTDAIKSDQEASQFACDTLPPLLDSQDMYYVPWKSNRLNQTRIEFTDRSRQMLMTACTLLLLHHAAWA